MRKLVLLIAIAATTTAAYCQWSYKATKDPMTDKVTNRAVLVSTNRLQMPFPYQGGVAGNISVQTDHETSPPGTDVVIWSQKGQVLAREGVDLKFDDGPIITFDLIGFQGGSSDGGFLHFPGTVQECQNADPNSEDCHFTSAQLVSKLSTSKKLKAKLIFYSTGPGVFEFSPKGLKWKID